jgi:hypothetical protein
MNMVTEDIIADLMPKIYLAEINQVARQIVPVRIASLDKSLPHLVQSITTKELAKAHYDVSKKTWRFNDGFMERLDDEFISSQTVWVVTQIDLKAFGHFQSIEATEPLHS